MKKRTSCRIAIQQVVAQTKIISFEALLKQVSLLGEWKKDTIAQHVMGLTVNLAPALIHWEQFKGKRVLFQHEDGRYEIYGPKVHKI